MPETEKGKALLKWQPNDKFKDEYDRIFRKKEEPINADDSPTTQKIQSSK
jgi:hypothetical protein